MSDVLSIIGRSQSKEILAYLAARDPVRFSDIEYDLQINPATVDRRLTELAAQQLVFREGGRYTVTQAGRDMVVMLALISTDWPEECGPDQSALVAVGTVVQLLRKLREAHNSSLYDLLANLPVTASDQPDREVIHFTKNGESHPIDADYLTMAEHYGLVSVTDDMIHSTQLGRTVLHLIESVSSDGLFHGYGLRNTSVDS